MSPGRRCWLEAASAALASEEFNNAGGVPDYGAAVAGIVTALPARYPDEMRHYVLVSDNEWASYQTVVGAIHALIEDVGDRAALVDARRSPQWPAVRAAARELTETMGASRFER